MSWINLFSSPMFYAILGIATFFGLYKMVPFVNKLFGTIVRSLGGKRQAAVVFGVLAVFFYGGFSWMLGSMGGDLSSDGVMITDLQVTTEGKSAPGCTLAEDNTIENLYHLRCLDAQVVEDSAGTLELSDLALTVTRSGDLSPTSCHVQAYSNDYTGLTAATQNDGIMYNIVEKSTTQELEVYFKDGSANATTSDPKESVELAFAEGDATSILGISIEVDEAGHDALNQYDSQDVVVDICGMPYTFRIHRMD